MNLNYTERDFSKIRLHRKRYRRQRAIARGWKKLCHWLRWLRYLKYLNPFRYLNRLDRYIINKFIGTYIYSIVLIISIAIVFDVNENLAKFSLLEPVFTAVRVYCRHLLYVEAGRQL